MTSRFDPAALTELAELLAPDQPDVAEIVRRAADDPARYRRDHPELAEDVDQDSPEDIVWEALFYELYFDGRDESRGLIADFEEYDADGDYGVIEESIRNLDACPDDLDWDWFDPQAPRWAELDWDAGEVLEAVLPEVGERSLRHGVALLAFAQGLYEVCFVKADVVERITELTALLGRQDDLFVVRAGTFG